MQRVFIGVTASVVAMLMAMSGCALFEDENTAKGRKLYHHYCTHCHGENGYQAEGFNWDRMPDPRPRDLSEDAAMSTFSDKEIFDTISREMRDTSLQEVNDDMNYFAVATMPTFKYTLSEQELWAVVGFVRTLHGGDFSFDLESRRQQLETSYQDAKQALDIANQALEAAEEKRDAEIEAEEAAAEAAGDEDFEAEEIELPEEELAIQAEIKHDEAKAAFENFTKRPKRSSIARPDLTVSDGDRTKLEEKGKHLYSNTYGCNGCHSIGDVGGLVGPALDRVGFRLNDTWVYRWIMYPQAMKKHTRMPNLGINDQDARALTAYLDTLRAPKPDKPIPPPE